MGVVFLLVFTKPLPPKDVYLAVGQEGSKFEAIGKKFVPYFAEQGLDLHLVHTKGSAANLATLANTTTEVHAALAVVSSTGRRNVCRESSSRRIEAQRFSGPLIQL